MTSIAHALIGAAIAGRVSDPATAAILAFSTHFICDAIPHWDLGTNWRLRPKVVTGTLAIAETLIALSTYLIFAPHVASHPTLAIAIIFSLLPDWLEAPYYLLQPHPPKIFVWNYKLQSFVHERLQAPWGVVTQAAVAALFLFVGFGVK